MPFTHLISVTCVPCAMRAIAGLLLIAALGACSGDQALGPAPLGDKAALEQLAKAYRQVSSTLPASPTGLAPAARRKFLEQTFHQAGYDYSATLIALSRVPKSAINQHHIDLKQLLYLPHYDRRIKQLSDIYSQEEIAAIKVIDNKFE